jgi:hypothetical protein
MQRVLAREILDDLAVDDAEAVRARRDLQRVHRAMGTRSIVLQALRNMDIVRNNTEPLHVLELGAGDGSLMLGIAQELAPHWPLVHLTLLDAQPLVTAACIDSFAHLGWMARSTVVDVFDWARDHEQADPQGQTQKHWDLVVANLFSHHFDKRQLRTLLRTIAIRSDRFLACEPRRARFALLGSHLIGALGTSAVTRNDAVLSVHAGFRGDELSALWPGVDASWRVREYAAGLFSHCFIAQPLEDQDANPI